MARSLELEIRDRLTQYLRGKSSLQEFKAWFIPATWDVTPESDRAVHDLTTEVHLRLAEFDQQHWTEAELREQLRPLAVYFILTGGRETTGILFGTDSQVIRSWLAAPMAPWIRTGKQSVKVS